MKKSKGEVNVPQPNHQNSFESNNAVRQIHKPAQDFSVTKNQIEPSNSWVSLRSEHQVRNSPNNSVNLLN